jgi:hypothetical protein
MGSAAGPLGFAACASVLFSLCLGTAGCCSVSQQCCDSLLPGMAAPRHHTDSYKTSFKRLVLP